MPDEQDQDGDGGVPLSLGEALERIRAIRARLAAQAHEPPSGRRRPPPPTARARPGLRERLEAIEGEDRPDPPETAR